jgi:hypothetical protein
MHRNVSTTNETTRDQQQLEEKRRYLIEQKYKRTQLSTLDLLRADRSSLNTNQWGVISNITNIYDALFEEQRQKIFRLQMNHGQKPVKIRLKIANYQELVSTYFEFIVPFLEHLPDYQSLDLFDRSTLIHHNMITLTGIHSHYIASTTGFIPYFDKNYIPIVEIIYGNEIVFNNERLRQESDAIFHTDFVLVKLLLVILAFSNYTSCLSFTPSIILKSMDNEMIFAKKLFTIQNQYIDILWRYMLFRFRNEELVIHLYSKIIYHCLHVQNFTHQVAEENDQHKNMYENFIEEIERKLDLHDEF